MILMLSACTSDSGAEVEPVTPPPSAEDHQPVEDGQMITVVTPETAKNSPEEKSKYQIQTRLTDFHMLSETSGAAWGLTGSSLRLYLTEDYGETWVDISPSSRIHFMDKLVYGRDLFFTDQDHGWIVRSGKNQTDTILLNTTNGGREWKLSALPNMGEVTAIDFSSERGWIMTAGKSFSGIQEKVLHRTDNQGSTWNQVMQNVSYPASRVPDTVIPRAGAVTGMSFMNTATGFAAVRENQGTVLYVTRDGGKTWSPSKRVFDHAESTSCRIGSDSSPVFLGSTQKLWVPVQCGDDSKSRYMGFFSLDSGKTWEKIPFELYPKTGTGNIKPFFYRMDQGWSIIDGIVYKSNDMGKTWTAFEKDEGLSKNLERYPIISKIQFASPEVGWMLVETQDGSRSRLLLSSDGGESWKVR
ncbi:hypothetical protein HII30_08935 [Paenibacillus lemnae]|uniref:Photosynthesis system II assembly factor Ycf48/Hcf136-like domain-containing protein n=2 Tax=Paenibacillus lemnae TaxID=1330551 RepID=A0A848M732_PAELE|nr:YCF48-related protein [Paenibacillus lemnae]NMO95892.1 hypothetical protein [Paenibacillus lemnae]